ncbi:SpoIIE family protein phosphatase [Streptomyces sp. NPDC056707]|uniref:SpoIIE family protein phosphatase n=1 Tax=Streptomyces sp. NPDC056707 TaxID=3345919 RepID=UPI0036BF685E
MSGSKSGSGCGPGAFDTVRAATAVVDEAGTVVGWSRAAEELLGYSASDVLGRPASELLASGAPPGGGPQLTESGWAGPALLRHRDGRPRTLLLRISPMFQDAGSAVWSVVALNTGQSPWWGMNRMVLEELFTGMPIGMAMLDTDLRYIWVNDTLTRASGVPREHRLGRRMDVAFPPHMATIGEGQLRRVLETGVPLTDYEYRGPTLADPAGERAYSAYIFRLEDQESRVTGVCYLVVDVTERWHARQRLALLSELGACQGGTLDVLRATQETADVAVPEFADFLSVDLLDPVLHGELPDPDPVYVREVLRRAGQRSVLQEHPETPLEVGDRVELRFPGSSPTIRCLAEAKSTLEPVVDVLASAWVAEAAGRAERVRDLGLHSVMVVPICADGAILGVMTFARWRRAEPFTEEDLLFAEEFAARAGLSLDRARRFTREHATAVALQRSLLPTCLAAGVAMDIAWRYLPAELRDGVGGDWCDVIPLSGARVALVVGDVVGRGIHAAAAMGRLRTAVHTLADMDLPPDELLAHLDDMVLHLTEEEVAVGKQPTKKSPVSGGLGATCLYVVYDPVSQSCTMARAGHPPPAIVSLDGTIKFPELPAGPPLGLGGLPFESAELPLPSGSVLALYTNGLIVECDRDIDVGLARLSSILAAGVAAPLEEVADSTVQALLAGPPADDAALLLARARNLGEDDVSTWDLPTDPAIVGDTRDRVLRQLHEWGLGELSFSTELIVSELVTNAIRYGGAPIQLRLIRSDVLICEVSDGSNTSPRLRHARTTDEGGRGLFLVAQLALRWGARYTGYGKAIWAEQPLPST